VEIQRAEGVVAEQLQVLSGIPMVSRRQLRYIDGTP
jgi:hypothetical protein